jgi:hypothetical protein
MNLNKYFLCLCLIGFTLVCNAYQIDKRPSWSIGKKSIDYDLKSIVSQENRDDDDNDDDDEYQLVIKRPSWSIGRRDLDSVENDYLSLLKKTYEKMRPVAKRFIEFKRAVEKL